MKKRLLPLLLALALALLLSACGGEEAPAPAPESGRDGALAIVIGDEADRPLARELQASLGGEVPIRLDSETPGGEREILLGHVDRPLALRYEAGLREKDCWVRFLDGAILIQGGTAEKLREAAGYFVQTLAPLRQDDGSFPAPEGAESPDYLGYGLYALQALNFDGREIFEYSIVTAGGQETDSALLLREHIRAMSGYTLPIIAPEALTEGQAALIFGSSGARAAAEKTAALEEKQFLLQAEGDSLYLCAWDEADEPIAAWMFLGQALGCKLYTDTPSKARLSFEDYSFKFTTAFDGSGKFKSMNTQVFHFNAVNEFNILQGGCTDGTYAYYLMEDQQLSSGNCVIVKLKAGTWETVKISEPLPLDHGNGVTYVPQTGRLLVSHCSPDPTLASWVDAETLELIETVKLDFSTYAMSYQESRDLFACYGIGKVMLMVDPQLQVVRSINGMASSYETQGYDVDDDYIYIVTINSNYIHVCDWEGHWLETIPIGVKTEMENMISFGDIHYTGFLNAGADLYLTIFYRTLYS